ncbi:hypothetical protein E2C01_033526 [Portunus trituberculatus]|uniref:Uncharacterized protein n=1 Tax=Portunus trituberculatus TaxID=210409 RepID=A0A5B7F4F7_PORTR|nr:hypothetical protein [Portunus trituberculatus]
MYVHTVLFPYITHLLLLPATHPIFGLFPAWRPLRARQPRTQTLIDHHKEISKGEQGAAQASPRPVGAVTLRAAQGGSDQPRAPRRERDGLANV